MNKNAAKEVRRSRRRVRIRRSIIGVAARPRLAIYKSLNGAHLYLKPKDKACLCDNGPTLNAFKYFCPFNFKARRGKLFGGFCGRNACIYKGFKPIV